LLILGLALRLHHQFHGPPIDYAGLAAAAAASWAGVPGPGEPVLIAAGIFAARHKLDIASVVVVAWAGAFAGGIVGWALGFKAGRAVITAPGPLLRLRRRAVEHGEEVFARWAVLAIVFTPSWIAGIHRVRARLYVPVNAIASAGWAAGIGLGAYYVGPTVVDFVGDLGIATIVVIVFLAVAVAASAMRRRRRAAREAELRKAREAELSAGSER
jgi:membrane protein DedA with SNARE-associated domain